MALPLSVLLCLTTATPPGTMAPIETTGVLVTAKDPQHRGDSRLRRLTWRYLQSGYESHVAVDLANPRVDVDEEYARARRKALDARQASDGHLLDEAAKLYDGSIATLEKIASNTEHLAVLVTVLVERGAIAMDAKDSATAEALFLRALAIAPDHVANPNRVGADARKLFDTVKSIVAKRPKGKLTVDVGPGLTPEVRVDFGAPISAPYMTEVHGGSHYVSVTAPGRAEVIVRVDVRANDEAVAIIRPPLPGSRLERTRTVDTFRANEQTGRGRLITLSGLRFLVVATFGREAIDLDMFDSNGSAIIGGVTSVGLNPSDADLDGAIKALMQSAASVEPSLAPTPVETGPGWYTTWWGVTLISVAAAGAAVTTGVLIAGSGETSYVFRP